MRSHERDVLLLVRVEHESSPQFHDEGTGTAEPLVAPVREGRGKVLGILLRGCVRAVMRQLCAHDASSRSRVSDGLDYRGLGIVEATAPNREDKSVWHYRRDKIASELSRIPSRSSTVMREDNRRSTHRGRRSPLENVIKANRVHVGREETDRSSVV